MKWHNWPPRSPDLTPLDYYLWSHLKSKVYKKSPSTIQDLKENIRRAINEIPVETLKATMRAMGKRAQDCLEANGGPLKGEIFKS